MIISEHAGRTIAHQSGGWEPQRTNNFALVITGLADTEKLILCTKSVKIPPPTITKQTIKFYNDSVNYAGALDTAGDMQIGFRDYLDIDTISVLSAWFKQVYNPETGGIGWASQYKKTAEVFLLPPGTPTAGGVSAAAFRNRVWKLQGVWPSALDYPELSMDGAGEQVVVTMTLAVDRAFPAQMGNIG